MQGPFGACPSCGGAVGATARFCGSCGRPIAAPPVATLAPRSSGSKIMAITAVAAVAIVAIGVGAGLLLRSNAGGTGNPGASGGTGGATTALATPPIVDGFADETALTPPILEEGEVPAPEDATPPLTGHLSLGAATDLATQTIGAAGGTIAAGGFEIRVPDGALAADTTFDVKQAPITGQDFGDLITPLTPLYLLDDGEAALAAPVTVVLPATIPDGKTAMAFTYDDATGRLSPLIPIAQDATSLTVGATHFSGNFVALVDLAKLPQTVDSGFRPGADDWQFTNYGSYVAPGGQCEGQSVSAIWYYVNQRRKGGASPLYGLYDNNGAPAKTPTFWPDDSDGYRLAGAVQADSVAVPFTYDFLKSMWNNADGRFTYQALRTAIALSGEPQLVQIDTAAHDAPHAIIAYRVTPDRIFVADPNYPGRLRTIRYDAATGKLGPYSSGSNAAEIAANGAHSYTRFAYMPPQASSSDAAMAAYWAAFEGGTAGDAAFPRYALEALAGKDAAGKDVWVPLVDGYRTTEKKLTLRLRAPARADDVRMKVYRGTSSTMATSGARVTIDLEDGENPLGIAEQGHKAGWTDWEYVDFVRLTVTSGQSNDWELADVKMTQTSRHVSPDFTWVFEGDGRGGISTIWSSAFGSPATARVDATWQIPDRLTPGSEVDVSGGLKVAIDYESDGDSWCGDGTYQAGPEDAWLMVRGINQTGTEPVLTVGMDSAQPISILDASIGCDTTSGKMVGENSASGSFTVPDRLVPAAGQTPFLVVTFTVDHDLDGVTVSYVYK